MKIINVITSLPWKVSNGTMKKALISHCILHHDAVPVTTNGYNTMERLKNEAKVHIAKGWNHISYHYCIDNLGDVYQCLPETEVGYHAGNLAVNKSSIAICVHGNFEIQQPTKRQLVALQRLLKYLCTERNDLPKLIRTSVKGHRDIKQTSCPGKNLYKWLNSLNR